jgi:uncharacterized membrane protein
MIIALTISLIALIFSFGSNRTAKSIVTISINFSVFFLTLIMIYFGINAIIATVIGCILISLITLFYQNDINIKTKISFFSVCFVIFISLFFTCPVVYYGNIQGFPVGQYEIRPSNGYLDSIDVNMMYLQIAVILIVLIGSSIDTSLAVSSSLYEVKKNNPKLNKTEIFLSGITIGKGIISSTINTLFFIFIAEYMSLFLYFAKYYTFSQMINSKEFAQEVITIAIAGIASILTIPITSLICSQKYK